MPTFSRIIRQSDPIIPFMSLREKEHNSENVNSEYYNSSEDDISKINIFNDEILPIYKNCHWGSLKLFYSELEFINLVSKYIDINECLVLYIGAQPGFRLKHLFIKHFFPEMKMLLYDPLPFDITEDENIIIKTRESGWFTDETVNEVLKIANGRKIIYIADIRLSDEDDNTRESLIHDDLQKQQKWGIMMDAEFMLLKFRMFYYKKDPSEVDFINNTIYESYKDKVVFTENEEKHNSKDKWLLYLDGTIFPQIYSGRRSTETRLFVKKIKYYKNKYPKECQDKYKMTYYDNIQYEGILNNFNIKRRNERVEYRKSKKLTKYIPGVSTSYSSASEYYIVRKYLISRKIKPSFNNILNEIILIHTFFNMKYSNNLIMCGLMKNYAQVMSSEKINGDPSSIIIFLYKFNKQAFFKAFYNIIENSITRMNKQLHNLLTTKRITNNLKEEYGKSIKRKNKFYYINNQNQILSKIQHI